MNRDEIKATMLEGVEAFVSTLPKDKDIDFTGVALWARTDAGLHCNALMEGETNRELLAIDLVHLFQMLSKSICSEEREAANDS